LTGVPSNTTVTVAYDSQRNLTVKNNGAWNDVKNAALTSAVIKGMTVNNFVAVNVSLTNNQSGVINVTDAKRGTISTGSGNDTITVSAKSNATSDNLMTIKAGDGTNKITFSGASNTKTSITTGSGADTITITGQAGSTVSSGGGDDALNIRSSGTASVAGGTGRDLFSFLASAHATITDFTSGQDKIQLSGVTGSDVRVHTSGSSTLIDVNGRTAVTLTGVQLSASALNISYA
jgi:hypothetical protein